MCLRDAQSRTIHVQASDLRRNPFDPKDPQNGVVEMVRLHTIEYSRAADASMEDIVARKESKLREAAEVRRSLLSTALFGKGARRNQLRGQNRAAAYQQAPNDLLVFLFGLVFSKTFNSGMSSRIAPIFSS